MRYLLVIFALIFSLGAFAQDVNSTITGIEIENSAQCNEVNTSMDFCLNLVCLNYQTFQCYGEMKIFKVKLKVVTKRLADGSYRETVKKVKYIK